MTRMRAEISGAAHFGGTFGRKSILEFDLGRGLKTRREHLPEKGENRHFPSTVATHAKIWSVRGMAAKRGGRENSTQGREEREGEREREVCRLQVG